MDLLPIHDSVTSYIGHLENTESLNDTDLPNVCKLYFKNNIHEYHDYFHHRSF